MDAELYRFRDETSLARLSRAIELRLVERGGHRRPVVFACVGTDRSTGDALGPLVGERLRRLGCDEGQVIGTLENPLHALNLDERLRSAFGKGSDHLVVAIDAALGPLDRVGGVSLHDGGLRPGQGVGKDLPEVGELSLTATVNVQAGALDVQVLQSTRLWLVNGLAELIGTAAWWGLESARRAERRPAYLSAA